VSVPERTNRHASFGLVGVVCKADRASGKLPPPDQRDAPSTNVFPLLRMTLGGRIANNK
jgi:hypothetical protein